MLDTNVAIHLRDSDPATLRRFATIDGDITMSIITQIELEGGVVRETSAMKTRRAALDRVLQTVPVLDFGEREAVAYRMIVETLGFSRSQLLDRMIAAQAIVAGAVLATLNPRDFRSIPGLKIEDWTAA